MKHFKKLNCVTVQIDFPKSWQRWAKLANLDCGAVDAEVWAAWVEKLTACTKITSGS